tara:strand:- start:25440 stop:26600 length:1161 start_codon:yes stop_codon:yes gene_type:complete
MEIRKKYNIELPKDILMIRDVFKKNGYKLYLVGGAVRDAVSGITPKDYDLATDALPDEVDKMLSPIYKMLPIGEKFGIWLAITPSGEFEIATFRKDVGTGRRPDSVEFTTIDQDVLRRDLTINALFYDIEKQEIVDLVGGIEDLKNGVVKSVGNPADRFEDDKLRKLRAIRFAGVTGSELDREIHQYLLKDPGLEEISAERIRDEFLKGIAKSSSVVYFMNLLDKYNFFNSIFPNLNINAKYVEEKDYIINLATLLKENDSIELKDVLNKVTYSNEEIKNILFLKSLVHLNEENALNIKKSQYNTSVTDEQILKFAKLNELDEKLIRTFIQYIPSISGKDVMDKMNIKGGPEVGEYIKKMEADIFKDLMSNESYRFKYIKEFISYE